ncbi:NADH-quinone oxidoreductase subunit N [Buchnera aphidicola]|nr:NADH-quinone oxidoreductase subunit N [Buchnera aphidicola]
MSYRTNTFVIFLISICGILLSIFSIKFYHTLMVLHPSVLFKIGNISIEYMIILLIHSLLICLFSYFWIIQNKKVLYKEEFYLFLMISTLGGLVVIISNHALSFFLGVELVSVPLIGMLGYTLSYKEPFYFLLKYGVLSSISSIFMLLGMTLMYAVSGSLNISEWELYLLNHSIHDNYLFLSGFYLFISSLIFKFSMFPFHSWIAEIYEGAPIISLSHFSSVYKIIFILILSHFFIYFPMIKNHFFYFILEIIACSSILFGSIRTVYECDNIKKFFAYTSIIQSGYIIAIIIASLNNNYEMNFLNINFYMISYLLNSISLFSIFTLTNLIIHTSSYKDISLNDYTGLFWKEPLLTLLMTITLFSLSGIPLTCGFIGKCYLLLNILQNDFPILGICCIIGSIVSIFYYFRIINKFYSPILRQNYKNNVDNSMLFIFAKIVIILLVIYIIYFGINPNSLINFLNKNNY